jgi:type I restriction enzyme, R subunit
MTDINLSSFIWSVADLLRSDYKQSEYGRVILPFKLLESETLRQQAANNTKEQFANSPDLNAKLLNAIMSALNAHTTMSTQA